MEKNINRSKVYKDLLDRNIKSRRYKGDPELQNIELSANRDRMVRETNQPVEQLSKVLTFLIMKYGNVINL